MDENIKVMPRIEWITIACISPTLQKSPAAVVLRRHISSSGLCVPSNFTRTSILFHYMLQNAHKSATP
jgi:hypothetical protein